MSNKLTPLLNTLIEEITEGKVKLFNPNHPFGGLPKLSEDEKQDYSVYSETCYICRDSDFRDYGLPLCYSCPFCEGHIAADDTECDNCGKDARESVIVEGED
jgi:hypothetical protein